jgi:cell division protein FtsB
VKIIIAIMIVLFFILQYELWYAHGGILDVSRLKHKIREKTSINEDVNAKSRVLQEEIEYLKQSQAAVEGRAREEFGMVKKDETFYQVVDENQK